MDADLFSLNKHREYPSSFIQWKGTDVCLDFTCECGWYGHFDGYFAYGIRCGGCGKVWEQQTHLVYREGVPDNGLVVDPDPF